MFTHYKDKKSDAKCRNCGGLGVKGDVFNFSELFSKVAYLTYPICSCRPRLGWLF